MKKLLFFTALLACLFGMSVTGFAKTDEDEAAKEAYETAIADNWKDMLQNSIALDKINAENKTHLLKWQDVEDPSEEAKKLVTELLELQKNQEKEQESMDPYMQAKKNCDEKLNADGANAALENVIRIQKDRLADQEEIAARWKKVNKLLE
ncbi:MAG: hypothetical protein HFE83_00440 [Lachnospiraceae bacterium]|nr:hypothetical protein [Lachnospiraceae bacterium]